MTYSEIKLCISNNGGVLTTFMRDLREAQGAGALGCHVCEQIMARLAELGIGHVPTTLPRDGNAVVRLHLKDTEIGRIIDAVCTPGADTDQVLKDSFGPTVAEYRAKIQAIRDIVA